MSFPFIGTHSPDGWASWQSQNVAVTEEGVSIAPATLPSYVSAHSLIEEIPAGRTIVDVDVGTCGDLYLLSSEADLYLFDRRTDSLRRLPCTWNDAIERPRGLCVTGDTIYVADAGRNVGGGRIHAASKHLLQPRWIATESIENPVALVGDGDDVYLLDAGHGDGGVLATLNRHGVPSPVITDLSDPVDAALDREGNRYVLDAADEADGREIVWVAGEADASSSPAPDQDSNIEPTNRTEPPRPEPPPNPGGPGEVLIPSNWFRVSGSSTAFEPACIEADHVGEVLVGVDPDTGVDRPLFRYRTETQAFERLVSFSGQATTLQIRRDRRTCEARSLLVVSGDGTSVSALDAVDATGLNGATRRYDAQLVTRLDAGIEGVEWHRVTMGLSLPATATQVRLRYVATDDPGVSISEADGECAADATPSADSSTDPEAVDGIGPIIGQRLREAGVECLSDLVSLDPETIAAYASTPTYAVSARRTASWIEEAQRLLGTEDDDLEWIALGKPNPRDALLDGAVGRYLFIRLELVGTEFDSPTVESFQAYFPRQSYLRHLPEIYQEDAASAAFLERFLSIFESIFTDIEADIGAAIRYLDPDGVPSEYVGWLERWLALETDETWSTDARRELLRGAPELFKYRGTRRGVLATLDIFLEDRLEPPSWLVDMIDHQQAFIEQRLAAGSITDEAAAAAISRLDPTIYIWEDGDLDCIDDEAVRAVYEQLLPCPQCFAVLVPFFVPEETVRTVDRIVRTQQPAHGAGRAIQLRPRIRLAGTEYDSGAHTYLGVNSVLTDRDFVLEESGLGTDTKLTEHEPDGQLGLRARLGSDTRIS